MAIEFERRFLVDPRDIAALRLQAYPKMNISQGYVCGTPDAVVRIRSSTAAGETKWYLTVKKSTGEVGKSHEFESLLEAEPAADLYHTLTQTVSKTRFIMPLGHLNIELDVMGGRYNGLIIAEVELAGDADSQYLDSHKPTWFGKEITGDSRYSNYSLAKSDESYVLTLLG